MTKSDSPICIQPNVKDCGRTEIQTMRHCSPNVGALAPAMLTYV